MPLTRTQRAAIFIARKGLMEKLRCSEEAFLQLCRGGTTEQRSAALKASRRGRARSRRKKDAHSVELVYAVRNPRPRHDRRLERGILNQWGEVIEAIIPTHAVTGAKLRTPAEFRQAWNEPTEVTQ